MMNPTEYTNIYRTAASTVKQWIWDKQLLPEFKYERKKNKSTTIIIKTAFSLSGRKFRLNESKEQKQQQQASRWKLKRQECSQK